MNFLDSNCNDDDIDASIKKGVIYIYTYIYICDSVDPLVKSTQPAIIIGQKWNAKHVVETAESSLKMKEVIGSVTTGRAGFSLHPQWWWSKETTNNKPKIVFKRDSSFWVKQTSCHSCGTTQTRCMDYMGKHPTFAKYVGRLLMSNMF